MKTKMGGEYGWTAEVNAVDDIMAWKSLKKLKSHSYYNSTYSL
jgi:hypothetical protein